MSEENRRSVLHDILKREKENKKLNKEKPPTVSKSIPTAKSLIDEKSSSTQTNSAKSKPGLSAYDEAINEVASDIRFYLVRDGDYTIRFKDLYDELKLDMNKFGINARKYLDYVRESFDRFKSTHKMMPLAPMNAKAYKYVESSFRELLNKMQEKFKK